MTTHSELFRAAYAADLKRKKRLHVQYSRQGVGVCAELVELIFVNEKEWVRLWSRLDGYIKRPCHAIRVCEGDVLHHCSCATSRNVNFSRASVVAPHESLNFETLNILKKR